MTDQLGGAVPRPLGCDEARAGQLVEPLFSVSYRGCVVWAELVAGISALGSPWKAVLPGQVWH
jgi:hypothetical protein